MRSHGLMRCLAAGFVIATIAHAASTRREALQKLRIIPDVAADFGRGKKILGDEVKAILMPQVQSMLSQQREVTQEDIREWATTLVNSMIDQQLLLAEAVKQGVDIDIAEGQSLVRKQRRRLGERTFEQMLRLQGVDETQYAMRLAENLAVQQWIDNVIEPRQTVSTEEARAYYEAHPDEFPKIAEYHVSHILLAVSLETSYEDLLEKQDLGRKIRQKLAEGEDFANLAREYSDCPSKADGGDLGWLSVNSMPDSFEEVATNLQPGDVSELVRTPQGYHIIKAHEFRAAGTLPFEKVKDTIVADLEARKLDEAMRSLTSQLRKNANVQLYIEAP